MEKVRFIKKTLLLIGGITFYATSLNGARPLIADISPNEGTEGTLVVIHGSNLSKIEDVKFGDQRAVSFTFSSTQIRAIAPHKETGAVVNITVTNNEKETSPINKASRYTYLSYKEEI